MVSKVSVARMLLILNETDRSNCSYLNHRRYAQNDDTLYVAPEDDRTDYVSSKTIPRAKDRQPTSLVVTATHGQLVRRSTQVSCGSISVIVVC